MIVSNPDDGTRRFGSHRVLRLPPFHVIDNLATQ